MVDGAGPGPGAADPEVRGLMDTPDPTDVDIGTQPASFDDLGMDSMSTMRPMATQAIFRPHFDDDDSVGSVDTEPEDHHNTTVARLLSPTRRLGGGLLDRRPHHPGHFGSHHRAIERLLVAARFRAGRVLRYNGIVADVRAHADRSDDGRL